MDELFRNSETCEIRWRRGFFGWTNRFVAQAIGPEGAYTVAESEEFAYSFGPSLVVALQQYMTYRTIDQGQAPIENDPKAQQAFQDVTRQLALRGWRSTGRIGGRWYEVQFVRQISKPQIKQDMAEVAARRKGVWVCRCGHENHQCFAWCERCETRQEESRVA